LNPTALAIAKALDAERAANKIRGPLHGIPFIIKDNIETMDPVATTAGSYALAQSRRPADAPLIARLRARRRHRVGQIEFERMGQFSLDPFL